MMTRAQHKGQLTMSLRAKQRLNTARTLSQAGVSLKDAAERIGMKQKGLEELLRRNFGTQRWPIAEENL